LAARRYRIPFGGSTPSMRRPDSVKVVFVFLFS
jgi:hypothetical protein